MAYVIDLETERKNRGDYIGLTHPVIGRTQASPYHIDNNIVIGGQLNLDTNEISIFNPHKQYSLSTKTLIVGQNITFDILWLLQKKKIDIHKIEIWDTMIAEYYLSGQQTKYASLDTLAKKYGGYLKDDKIKNYWLAGIETSDIPKHELAEYLEGDLENTAKVFKRQLIEFKKEDPQLLTLFLHVMRCRLLTTLMEFNGILVDSALLDKHIQEVSYSVSQLEASLKVSLDTLSLGAKISSLNVSKLLFGGEVRNKRRTLKLDSLGNQEYFKNGNPRYCTIVDTVTHAGYEKLVPTFLKASGDGKYWLLPADVLEPLLDTVTTQRAKDLITNLLDYRLLKKELSTYLEGYRKHVWRSDNRIHTSLNHTATDTGRIASGNPNMLNISGK